jgi:tight adherence protein C
MLWAITGITFLATVGILAALLYAFSAGETGVGRRLSRVLDTSVSTQQEAFSLKTTDRFRVWLASIGGLFPSSSGQASRSQLMMVRAGIRRPDAMLAMRGIKLLMPVALVATAIFSGIYETNPFFILMVAAVGGYMIPEMWLMRRIRSRQHKLRRGLADGLDLLVICVEAGLGLDQALLRVSQELKVPHPELSEELQLVNMEMRVGKSRMEALRGLAKRTGLDDIQSLVAMLVQTERFGTSIAQSLRVHSDDLRIKRRQRAEELSAKTTVKMVPPLVFFIFPALMAVILGPAVITLMRSFGSTLGGH